jgi:PHD/YefM family antitoxin component YafN of YafNO toxin-antitoxin module
MEAQYIVDEEGNRQSVVLSVEEYERLLDAAEELADIAAHDEAVADLESGRETRTLRRARGE